MILFILSLVLTGLIVGALGRLAVPGPNPMSIGRTILVGIGGSLLGGLVGGLIFGRNGGGILFAVLGAALIVYLLERLAARRSSDGSRPSTWPTNGG
jgi:uncharacterized membrane protein YeaQ/YmgE (transglycosylase-associated protein family)